MQNNDESSAPQRESEFRPHWRLNKWFPDINVEILEKMKAFHGELLRFNKATNLISAKTAENADLLHFADCIIGGRILLKACEEAKEIYDIGSGNGFPGIVLAILEPSKRFILVDSDMRKVEFLKHIASFLKLSNVEAIHQRVEDINPEAIECAVSRAFAPLEKAMTMCRKTIKPGGKYFHFKSDSWGTEVLRIPVQIGSFWEPSVVGNYNLPGVKIKLTIVNLKKTNRK